MSSLLSSLRFLSIRDDAIGPVFNVIFLMLSHVVVGFLVCCGKRYLMRLFWERCIFNEERRYFTLILRGGRR